MVENIKTALPRIEKVIMAEGIELKDKGAYYQGLCPFHEDKNPSLVVYKTNNHFFCFGCCASGDAVGFVMKYKNLSFHNALSYLNVNGTYTIKQKYYPRILELIEEQEKKGINVRSVYGDQLIELLIIRRIKKDINKTRTYKE